MLTLPNPNLDLTSLLNQPQVCRTRPTPSVTWCAGQRQRPSCKNCENLVVHKKKQAYSQSLATRVVATESGSVSWRRPAPGLIVRFQGKGRKKTEEGIDEDKTKFSAIWSLPQPLHPIMCDLSPSHLSVIIKQTTYIGIATSRLKQIKYRRRSFSFHS